jgi:hypothetical protein
MLANGREEDFRPLETNGGAQSLHDPNALGARDAPGATVGHPALGVQRAQVRANGDVPGRKVDADA